MARFSKVFAVLLVTLLTGCKPEISEKLVFHENLVHETAVSQLIGELAAEPPSAVLAELLQVSELSVSLSENPAGFFTGNTLYRVLESKGEEFIGQNFLLSAAVTPDYTNSSTVILRFGIPRLQFTATMQGYNHKIIQTSFQELLRCSHVGDKKLVCSSARDLLGLRQAKDYALADGLAKQVFEALLNKSKLDVPEKYTVFAKGVANSFLKQAEISELANQFDKDSSCFDYLQKSTLVGLPASQIKSECWEANSRLLNREEALPYRKKIEARNQQISKAVFGTTIGLQDGSNNFFLSQLPIVDAAIAMFVLLYIWLGFKKDRSQKDMGQSSKTENGREATVRLYLPAINLAFVHVVGAGFYIDIFGANETSLFVTWSALSWWLLYGLRLAVLRPSMTEDTWRLKKAMFKKVLIGLNVIFVGTVLLNSYQIQMRDQDVLAGLVFALWNYFSAVLVSRRYDIALGKKIKGVALTKALVGVLTFVMFFAPAIWFMFQEGGLWGACLFGVLGVLHLALTFRYLGRPKQLVSTV